MTKRWLFIAAFIIFLIPVFFLYRHIERNNARKKILIKGEKLAQQYCSTCHLFPEPDLLTESLWEKRILPNMGPRLGMQSHLYNYYPPVDFTDIPTKPLMSQEDWNTLVYYYLTKAPDTLISKQQPLPEFDSTFFVSKPFMNLNGGIVTALKSYNHRAYIADAIDSSLTTIDLLTLTKTSEKLSMPITDIDLIDQQLLLTSPGFLHPADHQMGMVLNNAAKPQILIDSLRRSLRTTVHDFDQNGQQDLLIGEFGHNYGQLSIHFQKDETFTEKVLSGTPGAIVAQVNDFNRDGLTDFMVLFAQGDERLVLYENLGNQKFKPEVIYRFPSIFGSLYFELADFNHDGLLDILYTNGDNGDYTPIPKPYHGVRILLNMGKNEFEEAWFYPMNGAAMAKTHDFDQDGKLDIIATANFTLSGKPSKEGLLFFHQNKDLAFTPYMFENGDLNQWNLLELVDADKDGDMDVLVGAMNLDAVRLQQSNSNDLQTNKTSILLLENNKKNNDSPMF